VLDDIKRRKRFESGLDSEIAGYASVADDLTSRTPRERESSDILLS